MSAPCDAGARAAGARRAARLARAAAEAASLPDDARLLDLQTVALAGGVSMRTLRSWTATGRLRVTRIGRSVRVRVSDWREFLARGQAP